jgi:hypothetical protein
MPNSDPAVGPNRNVDPDGLGFSSAVLSAFEFLQRTRQFDVRTVEAALVRYESSRVSLNIWQELRSQEIGLGIGRLSRPVETAHPFNLADIIYLKDEAKASAYRDYAAPTRDLVRVGVNALASQLRTYGSEALTGNDAVFDEMAARRSLRIKDHAVVVNDAQVRTKAGAAWARKDLAAVARLLGSIEDRLSPSELSKLGYARHHRANSPDLEP